LVRKAILEYQQQQQKALGETQTGIEICAGADETAFEQDVLVLMDLSSGYILVEEEVENRQYETWNDKAQQALTQVGVRVRSLVSDRAPALIKLALEGLECPSIADLFHPLWDLSKSVGEALSRQLTQADKKLAQAQQRLVQLTALAKDTTAQQSLIEQLQTKCALLQSGQHTYHRLKQQLTLTLHPFARSNSGFKTTTEIKAQLEQLLLKLKTLQDTHQLPKAASVLGKFQQQIPALAVGVNTWWRWVQHTLSLEDLDTPLTNWLLGLDAAKSLLATPTQQNQIPLSEKNLPEGTATSSSGSAQSHAFTVTLADGQLQHWRIVG